MNYTSGSIDNVYLFDLKKRFMNEDFTITLLTDKGKYLIRKYERNYNAHTIHNKLLEHMLI